MMTSKERIMAAWNGSSCDHVPLTTWCFGFPAPTELRWEQSGLPVDHWFSLRMEHIHTLPRQWTLDDEFRRVKAWAKWEIDDTVDVSVPWSMDPAVTWRDSVDETADVYPVMTREYSTPAGDALHAVSRTGEAMSEGWVVQPDHVPLFEDFNIPRGVRHLVSGPDDVERLGHLYTGPDPAAEKWFAERMKKVSSFSEEHGAAVQAWSAFGMDAVVWFTGVENAVLLALDHPDSFRRLVEIIDLADACRTRLAASNPGVDIVVQRGWYSSTDFWSPTLFDRFLFAGIKHNAEIAHSEGKKFGYVMTTGVEILGPRLAEAGVDVLYFADPIQDSVDLASLRDAVGSRMTLVGGTNSLSLSADNQHRIDSEVKKAIDILGPPNRFILHPVDAIFPDTPEDGVKRLVDAWMKYR